MDGKVIKLSDEEFETLKDIFNDWGSNCPYTDCDKYRSLGERLGILERETHTVLTKEEFERRNRFAEAMKPIMEAINYLLKDMLLKPSHHLDILYGSKDLWAKEYKIGSSIRIKLPTNYTSKINLDIYKDTK